MRALPYGVPYGIPYGTPYAGFFGGLSRFYTLGAKSGVETSTEYTSRKCYIKTGTDLVITIVNGTYSIDGGAFTADPGVISGGSYFQVKATSSASYETGVTVTATINSVDYEWVLTTMVNPNTVVFQGESTSFATDTDVVW